MIMEDILIVLFVIIVILIVSYSTMLHILAERNKELKREIDDLDEQIDYWMREYLNVKK